MRSFKFTLILVLAFSGLLSGYDIRLNDNKLISTNDIEAIITKIPSGTIDSAIFISNQIIQVVEMDGYFDAILDVSMSGSTVTIEINSGLQYYLQNFNYSFQGDELEILKTELTRKYNNQAASAENIHACLEDAIDIYSDNGYPFAQSKLMSLGKTNPNIMNLSLEITSGPNVIIDSVTFVSDKKVSSRFLRRKSGLEQGNIFSQDRIDQSLRNINSLGYLSVDGQPSERYSNNYRNCQLIYNIKHMGSNRIEGALGYNPKQGDNNGFLYGYVDLALYDPLGDGKSFFLKWNKPGISNSRLNLRFEYPFVFGSRWDADLDVGQERFSDFYLSLTTGVNFSRIISSQYNFNFGLRWSKINAQGETFRSIYNSRIYEAGLGLTLSSFSGNTYDISGASFMAQITYLHKRLYPTLGNNPEETSFNPFKTAVNLRLGVRLTQSLFTDMRIRFEGFSEDESLISPAEMVKLGGRHSIRGYSEEQFITPRALWTNLELGFYQEESLKSYIFVDMGYARLSDIYIENQLPEYDNQFLFGAGFGFMLFSGQTGLDLNIGWSRDANLSEGKLYLIVENRF